MQILDPTAKAQAEAATTQPAQRAPVAALFFGGLGVTVRYYAGATLAETATHDALVLDALTPRGFRLGPLLGTTVHVSGATVTHAIWRSLAGVDVLRFEAADLSPNPLITQTGRRLNMADPVLPGVVVTADPDLPVAPPAVSAMSWSLPDTATAGVPVAGSVTNDGNVDQAWSISGTSGLTVTPSSGTLPPGDSQALSAVAEVGGEYVMTLAAAGATITGNQQTVVVSEPAFAGINPPPAGMLMTLAADGDSNTEHPFKSTVLYHMLAAIGAPFEVLANSGKSGITFQGMVLKIDQLYTNGADPGYSGLPALGASATQGGTNGMRGITVMTPELAAHIDAYIAKAKTYSAYGLFITMPPAGGITTPKAAGYPVVLAHLRSLAASDPWLSVIDPWGTIIDEAGNIIPEYWLPDEYHPSYAAGLPVAAAAKPQLEYWLSNQALVPAPLVTDPSDVYPATDQWLSNPTLIGTGGSKGSGWTGTLANGCSISTNGSGVGGTVEMVPATTVDPTDTNPVPWIKITPTTSSAFAQIALTFGVAGGVNSGTLEQMLQMRADDLRNFNLLEFWLQNNAGNKITQVAYFGLKTSGTTCDARTLRQKFFTNPVAPGGSPICAVYIYSVVAASGPMGSIYIRCPSMRG